MTRKQNADRLWIISAHLCFICDLWPKERE